MNSYGISGYDRWKTASPPEYEIECCDTCYPSDADECINDTCDCHTDDGMDEPLNERD